MPKSVVIFHIGTEAQWFQNKKRNTSVPLIEAVEHITNVLVKIKLAIGIFIDIHVKRFFSSFFNGDTRITQ